MIRPIDLVVVAAFLVFIVWDGIRRGRDSKDAAGYFLAGRRMRWFSMGLSVMATQASAITLISASGQGFASGMQFLHFYLAIPFAMVVLCATVVPWFHRAGVFTAYEWLERRFDRPTRIVTSLVFLVSRSLAVGTVLYAPSLVLENGLGIPKWQSILTMGVLSTIYTAIGGNTAVILTDAKQMLVMVAGVVACFVVAIMKLPHDVSFLDALRISGASGRLDTFRMPADASAMFADKFNVLSGLLGGFFLFLGYFGADQEQVQRYLAGSSVAQSQKSLLVSAFAKVPMQFGILLLGVLIFVGYSFSPAPPFFRAAELEKALASRPAAEAQPFRTRLDELTARGAEASAHRADAARALLASDPDHPIRLAEPSYLANPADPTIPPRELTALEALRAADVAVAAVRDDGMQLLADAGVTPKVEKNDADYVFTHFLTHEIPPGIAGLVLAALFAAAISSLVSPLNSLATSAVWDLWASSRRVPPTDVSVVRATRIATLAFGALATVAAFWMGGVPIIEQVNRIGSMVYGSLFGVFFLGWLVPRARGAIGWMSFLGGLVAVASVHWLVNAPVSAAKEAAIARSDLAAAAALNAPIEFLWYNPIGFFGVLLFGLLFTALLPSSAPRSDERASR